MEERNKKQKKVLNPAKSLKENAEATKNIAVENTKMVQVTYEILKEQQIANKHQGDTNEILKKQVASLEKRNKILEDELKSSEKENKKQQKQFWWTFGITSLITLIVGFLGIFL